MNKNEELRTEEAIDAKFEEVDAEETTEKVKESKFKGFMTKAGAGIKKHGKKVAGVAALAAVGVIGYALGHKTGDHDSDYGYGESDSSDNVIDFPESDIVDVTEE